MAWQFNNGGTNRTISVTDYPGIAITGHITVCCWARWTANNTSQMVAKWGTDEAYLLGGMDGVANKPGFFIRVSNVNKFARVSNSYQNAGWNHFAGIFDGSNVRIKVNAGLTEDITGDATSGPIDAAAQDLRIGAYSSGTSDFVGSLEDVAIFNRVLSGAELQYVMRYGAEGVPGLQLNFKLTERPTGTVKNWARPGMRNAGTPTGALFLATGPGNQPLTIPRTLFDPQRLYSQSFDTSRTGTSAVTAPAATLTASGTVVNAYTGTSAVTAAAATLTASGTVVNPSGFGSNFQLLGIG